MVEESRQVPSRPESLQDLGESGSEREEERMDTQPLESPSHQQKEPGHARSSGLVSTVVVEPVESSSQSNDSDQERTVLAIDEKAEEKR